MSGRTVEGQASSAAGPHRHCIDLTNAWEPPRADPGPGWTRRFGRPTGLAAGDRVWLVIERPRILTVAINDTPLPIARDGGCEWRGEITPLLRVRNRLLIVPDVEDAAAIPSADDHGRHPLPAACGRLRLEIESAS